MFFIWQGWRGRLRSDGGLRLRLAAPTQDADKKKTPEGVFLMEAATGDQSNTGVSTPSTLCSFGEVVVYCMWIFFSGKM